MSEKPIISLFLSAHFRGAQGKPLKSNEQVAISKAINNLMPTA